MRHGLASALLLAASLQFPGCDSTDSDGGGSGSGFTAKVDGNAWEATEISITAQVNAGVPGSVILGGTQTLDGNRSLSLTITLFNVRGPGKYALGVGSDCVGGTGHVGEGTGVGANAHTWITPGTGSDGEVEITALGEGRIKGTFRYTSDTSGTRGRNGDDTRVRREVTEGRFDLPLQGTLAVLPDNKGKTVTADLGGEFYNAASIPLASLLDYTGKAGFQFSSGSSINGLSIQLEGVTDTGTFSLSNFPPIRTITAGRNSNTGTHCCWQTAAGDIGEIRITSFTPTRVKGTFSATLKPTAGKPATANLVITNGTFDVGIGL